MSITDEEHKDELTKDYYARSSEISQLPFKLSSLLMVASGLPLFIDKFKSTDCSSAMFKLALISSSLAILLEFIRLHLNMKHIDIIIHDSTNYEDWSPKQTWYGYIGAPLFWIRGLAMVSSLIFFIIAIIVL